MGLQDEDGGYDEDSWSQTDGGADSKVRVHQSQFRL